MTQPQTLKQQRRFAGLARNRALTIAGLALLGIGIGLISMMLGASYFGMPMFYAYFTNPMLVLLNLLPPLLLLYLAWFVGGRAWLAFFLASFVVLALSVIDFFKIQVRSEPLVITDFGLTEEVGNVAAGYEMLVNWKVYIAAAYLAGGTALSAVLLRFKPPRRTRLVGAAAAVLLSAVSYLTLYSSEKLYRKTEADYAINVWSNTEKSIAKGFTYPFIYNFQDFASKPPKGYKPEEAAALLDGYAGEDIPDDKKVSIVSVMLESYADLSALGVLDFREDVYGPLHALQAESVHGSLVVNTFAGGTINSERSYLTGYTHLGDCQMPTNSYVWYLKQQGYVTQGCHTGYEWYYDRDRINANLGFDTYCFLEDFETEDRTDEFFFSKVWEMFDKRDKSAPYFGYSLSFQNHGPYDSETTCATPYIEQGSLSDGAYCILNNYLSGIADTTERLSDFIGSFRELDEPVVVVLFGDHMPWMGNSYVVYNELGVNIDLSTEEGFYNFYSTPYLIWANDAAKEVLGNDFTGDGGDFSPCFLMNKVFDLCAWPGNAFMKASNALRETVGIVSGNGYYMENGVLTAELSAGAADVYRNYRFIEYYYQHNFSY